MNHSRRWKVLSRLLSWFSFLLQAPVRRLHGFCCPSACPVALSPRAGGVTQWPESPAFASLEQDSAPSDRTSHVARTQLPAAWRTWRPGAPHGRPWGSPFPPVFLHSLRPGPVTCLQKPVPWRSRPHAPLLHCSRPPVFLPSVWPLCHHLYH